MHDKHKDLRHEDREARIRDIESLGTCFAGFEKVCSESLTPNPKKADRLRHQKYW